VSVIWGYRKDRRSIIFLFVNHDDNKPYLTGRYDSLLKCLEIFICFPEDPKYRWIIFFFGLFFGYLLTSPFSNFLIVAVSGIFLSAGIIFLIIQNYRVQSVLNIVLPQILEIVRQLNINSNSSC
jgi:hypothetical protein